MQSVGNQGTSFGVQGNQNRAYGGHVVGEFIQNRNECQSQANANLYYKAESVRSQQNLNGTYTGIVEESNKNKSGYQGQTIGNMVYRESSVGLQHNSDGLQIGIGGSSTPSNAESNNELAETCVYAGTIEELDTYCKEYKVKEALAVLEILEKKGVTVDLPRYVLLIQACGNIGFLPFAKSVHAHLIRSEGRIHQVYVHNMILEMYSKCRSMCDAHEVFENMPERNLTSWDTMITGSAKNGHGEDAIDLFTQFKQAGLTPDGQMFMGVFLACSVLCDIDEGMLHFESMSNVYGIVPSMEHYTSVVKMFGSIGYLDEAMEFIEQMPVEPNIDIWETLMNLCRIHGNIVLEDHCTKIVRYLDFSRLAEKSKEAAFDHAHDIPKKRGLQEVPTRNIYEFKAGDKSFSQEKEIYALLKAVSAHMKEAGHWPFTKAVLHDIDEESKEESLLSHSERLAVAHGLLSSQPRQTMRVIKNLRVCVDCHNFLKIISKIVGRTLIIRDAKRFHRFQDGSCTCNDFW
ncbi:hypothetical protein AQUCO_02000242v1 [Aquilegia coerulea]|uniref:DYW domain-containing protein n=1 Tax=Aquilegia coerulea TaxID=218851 RepID=A0A2G5DHF2_AQUCA|nr:hypothetical protein AQUCO_02000242v1 [Aquilegia coerulea]